ncbi:MAG: 50S ribosomal protein L19 [Candidatus Subteraquimicrobiales bacterium]|nr:50S ribosomal protein L19 [Candidatus Subteraquimicrobiales bacterium]
MSQINTFEKENLKEDLPPFNSGDTVKVHYKVLEGGRERTQVFQGTVIRKRGSGLGSTFTVRKVSFGIGIEKTIPLHSPKISKIEILTKGKVRRSKLYYLREKVGKAARIKEKR